MSKHNRLGADLAKRPQDLKNPRLTERNARGAGGGGTPNLIENDFFYDFTTTSAPLGATFLDVLDVWTFVGLFRLADLKNIWSRNAIKKWMYPKNIYYIWKVWIGIYRVSIFFSACFWMFQTPMFDHFPSIESTDTMELQQLNSWSEVQISQAHSVTRACLRNRRFTGLFCKKLPGDTWLFGSFQTSQATVFVWIGDLPTWSSTVPPKHHFLLWEISWRSQVVAPKPSHEHSSGWFFRWPFGLFFF